MSNENTGTSIPGEVEGGGALSPTVMEDRARQKGWRPKEEFKGDVTDWVDAREFLGRAPLFDKIKDLKGELHKQQTRFEKDMEGVSAYIAQTEERAFKRAQAELKAARKAAMRSDDPEAVEKIEEQLETLESDHQKAVASVPKPNKTQGPTPEFMDWQERNDWFKLSATGAPSNEMTEDAIAIGTGYAAANPTLSHAKVLEHVEKKIRKMYAEETNTTAPSTKQRKDPVVESGGGNRTATESNTRKTKITRADLSEDQRKIMDTLVKRGALKDKAAKNKVSQEQQYLMDMSEIS